MALSLLSYHISDLCLGKPPLRCLSASSSSVSDAIAALKSSEDTFLSVWNCNHDDDDITECECLGKISMADVICHLSNDYDPTLSSLNAPVSVLLPKTRSLDLHVQPTCSLVEAIDLIIQGAQNLIVPIQTKPFTMKKQQSDNVSVTTTTHSNGQRFCWITQDDIIQFLLGTIGAFSPLPAISISDLGIINSTHAIIAVDYNSSASAVISSISRALSDQTSVAVIDEEGDDSMIGEISPMALTCCDETAAAAVATLSAGELMAYIDGANPPESLVQIVRNRLENKGLMGLLSLFDSVSPLSPSSGYSSEEESPGKMSRSMSSSARMARKSEAIVCNPKSSLMAVMIQAIAHRVNYAWVIEKDGCFVGMVTFVDILKVFRNFFGK